MSAVTLTTCWYCGTCDPDLAYEREHQLPLSLGGGGGADNIVDSCRACNRLKANRSAEQFRLEIECRLGEPVVFAGEASPARPATDITAVRSFAAQTGLVRLPEEVLAQLRATVLALRSAGYVDTTLGSFVADAIAERIVRWQRGELGPDQLGPQTPTLFEVS